MAIAVVGAPQVGTSGNASVTIAVPSGVTAGHLLVADLSFNTDDTILAQTGWTIAHQEGSATGALNGVLYRWATSSEPASYTFNSNASSSSAGTISAFSGVDTTTPLDVTPIGTTGGGNTITVGPITTVTNNALLYYSAAARSGSDTVQMDSALTLLAESTSSRRVGAAYEILATAGSSTPRTFTGTTTVGRSAIIVALRPAVTVTASGDIKVYLGSAFIAKPVKVWTGSAWVVKPVKRWTGSAWVTTTY